MVYTHIIFLYVHVHVLEQPLFHSDERHHLRSSTIQHICWLLYTQTALK